mgnify:CR=1 FL=1
MYPYSNSSVLIAVVIVSASIQTRVSIVFQDYTEYLLRQKLYLEAVSSGKPVLTASERSEVGSHPDTAAVDEREDTAVDERGAAAVDERGAAGGDSVATLECNQEIIGKSRVVYRNSRTKC